jgi:hypothetical protein
VPGAPEETAVSPRDEFRSNCDYYGGKCRKRLFRTKLLHDVTLQHLDDLLNTAGAAQYERSLREALEPQEREPSSPLREKLIKVVVESHFLNLKVNFEYFLSRMLYCLWSSHFEQLTRRSKKPVPLRNSAQALSGQGGRELVIDKVIPRHGLAPLAKCFQEATKQSLPDRLNTRDQKLWSQVSTAFEVRHLIEHRKGRIDEMFRRKVQAHNHWGNSSWRDFSLSQDRIEVREKDFEATFDAMVRAAEIITALTKEC